MSEHSMCQALADIHIDIQEALSREEQARIEAVTEILEITNSLTNNTRASLAKEISDRQEADNRLQTAIDAEIYDRQKAINDLDVTEIGGENTYISKISQTNGKISAEAGSIDTEVKKGSNNLVTSAAVWTAIDDLPEPMVFKGSLGTDGTVESLPTAATANTGHTYKVITAGTYADKKAKIGDTFVSTGTAWELIPSGDEPSGTVTSVSAGTGLTTGTDPITTSGTISLATSGATAGTYGPGSAVTGTNGTTISVPKVTVDAYGRVTDISNITYTSKDTTTAYVKTLTTAETLAPTRDSTYVVTTTANLTYTLSNCAVGLKVIFASTVATKINYKTPGATSNTTLSMAANTVETFISTGNGYIAAKDSQMWLT